MRIAVVGRAFHAKALSDVKLDTPHYAINMILRLENPYRIMFYTLHHLNIGLSSNT